MGNLLDAVALSVRPVIHWVDAPLIACAVVVRVLDPVQIRVAHVHVRRSQVYFGAQGAMPVGEFAIFHAFKNSQVFFWRGIPVLIGHARRGGCAFLCGHVFRRREIHICLSFRNQDLCPFVQLFEVIGSIKYLGWLETQPAHIVDNTIYVLRLFCHRVGIIETEVCFPAVFEGESKIEAYTFSVPNVQITIGFRWKTCQNAVKFTGSEVCFDNFFQKVERFVDVVVVIRAHCSV